MPYKLIYWLINISSSSSSSSSSFFNNNFVNCKATSIL